MTPGDRQFPVAQAATPVCELCLVDFEYAAEAIFEKVILFPQVKLGVKLGWQMLLHLDAERFGQRVQRRDLIQGRFVKRAAHQPAFTAIAVEIALAEVFQPDQTFVRVVKVNFRHPNSVLGKKIRDFHILTIFFPFTIVFY